MAPGRVAQVARKSCGGKFPKKQLCGVKPPRTVRKPVRKRDSVPVPSPAPPQPQPSVANSSEVPAIISGGSVTSVNMRAQLSQHCDYFGSYMDWSDATILHLTKERDLAFQKRDLVSDELNNLGKKLNEVQKELSESKEEMELSGKVWEAEKIALADKLTNAKEEGEVAQKALRSLMIERLEYTRRYNSYNQALKEKDAACNQAFKEKDAACNELNNLGVELNKVREDLSKCQAEMLVRKKVWDAEKIEMRNLTIEFQGSTSKCSQALKERDAALNEVKSLGSQLNEVQKDLSWFQAEMEIRKKVWETGKIELRDCRMERDSALNELENLRRMNKKLPLAQRITKEKEVWEAEKMALPDLTKESQCFTSKCNEALKEQDTALNELNNLGAELNEVQKDLSNPQAELELSRKEREAERKAFADKLTKANELLEVGKITLKNLIVERRYFTSKYNQALKERDTAVNELNNLGAALNKVQKDLSWSQAEVQLHKKMWKAKRLNETDLRGVVRQGEDLEEAHIRSLIRRFGSANP